MDKPQIPEWWHVGHMPLPQHVNRVSSIGHPCIYRNYLRRAEWKQQKPIGQTLGRIFDIGNMWERHFMKLVLDRSDIDVAGYQQVIEWPDLKLVGHLDLVVTVNGEKIAIDFKSCSPNAYRMINDLDSLRRSPYHYHRGYVTQVTLYATHPQVDADWCGLICVNKVTGEWKQVLWRPDDAMDAVDAAFEACKKINKALDAKPPLADAQELLATPGKHCEGCGFREVCSAHTSYREAPAIVLADTEVQSLMQRRQTLLNRVQPYDAELRNVEKQLKDHFSAAGKEADYDFGKTRVQVRYVPPKQVAAKEAYERSGYYRVTYKEAP